MPEGNVVRHLFSRPLRTLRAGQRANRSLTMEHLEERRLMAITSSFDPNLNGGTLYVSSDADDNIVVSASNGYVKINQSLDPGGAPTLAANVRHMLVTGGPDTVLIDLSAVTSGAFTQMIDTRIDFTAPAAGAAMVAAEPSLLADASRVVAINATDPQRFTALAEELIGPDWPEKLGVQSLDELNSASRLRRLLASDALLSAIDPAKADAFLTKTIGADYAARLGIADLQAFLRGGELRALLKPGAAAEKLGAGWSQVQSNIASRLDSAAQTIQIAVQEGAITGMRGAAFTEIDRASLPALPAPPRDGKPLTRFLETALGADWSEQLGVVDVQAAEGAGRWELLHNEALAGVLTEDRVGTALKTYFGTNWSIVLGIHDLPSLLESGAWRLLFDPGDLLASQDVPLAAPQSPTIGPVSPPPESRAASAGMIAASLLPGQVRTIKGSQYKDHITGSDNPDQIWGYGGDDTILGGGGNDEIRGNAGHDRLEGGDGDDHIKGDNEFDTTDYGEFGNDEIYGGAGDDLLDGAEGSDLVVGDDGDDDLLAGIGSANHGNDRLKGGRSDNAGPGDDNLFGGWGDDALDGGEGNDTLTDVVGGADELDGGEGDGSATAGTEQDYLRAGTGNDHLDGGEGNDILWGEEGDDVLIGGGHADNPQNDQDQLDGGAGNDTVSGDVGDDVLLGGDGDDTLNGGDGSDVLDGQAGVDAWHGGAGFDTPEIIDNTDAEYSELRTWNSISEGFNSGQRSIPAEYGLGQAKWTFSDLASDTYQVFVTWKATPTASENSPFAVADGNTTLANVRVNQRVEPSGDVVADRPWHSLGIFRVASGSLQVVLKNLGGEVLADAVRIERVANQRPTILTIGDRSVAEEHPLTFQVEATDDGPSSDLVFSLAPGAPAGATISASGLFQWAPGEDAGPGVYPITVQVIDSSLPPQDDSETFYVTVTEDNRSPVLGPPGNQSATPLETLSLTMVATDADLPANTLVYSLAAGAPTGAQISSAGLFTWTPSAADAGKTYSVTAVVTDNGTPARSASTTFVITVAGAGAVLSTPRLDPAADTGASDTDGVTKIARPTLIGTGPDGATVKIVTSANVLVGTGLVANGQYAITLTSDLVGETLLRAEIRDAQGQILVVSPSYLTVKVDTTSPSAFVPALGAVDQTGAALDRTNSSRPTFSALAEIGATVEIFSDGVWIGTGIANVESTTQGRYFVTSTVDLAEGSHAITARVTDAAGNQSLMSGSFSLTVDLSASAPMPVLAATDDTGESNSDGVTNKTKPTFQGTVEALSKVELLSDGVPIGEKTLTGSVTTYSLQPTEALSDGTHAIVARITDTAGNVAISAPRMVTIDTAAPDVPSIPDLAALSDSGLSSTDNTTNSSQLQFVGTAEADAKVTLTVGGQSFSGAATGGAYDITTGTLAAGTYNVSAKATDLAGNASEVSATLPVIRDTSAPTNSTFALASSSDSGIDAADRVTSDTTPTFRVLGPDDAAVELYAGQLLIGSVFLGTRDPQSSQPQYLITAPVLAEGAYSITARTIDRAGNVSVSAPQSITIDATAPAAPATPDLADASDNGAFNNDNITSLTNLTFTGTAEAGARVQLIADGALVAEAATLVNGNYSVTGTFVAGEHHVTARQLDKAGNLSATSGSLTVTVDTNGLLVAVRGPQSGVEGQELSFAGAYTDPTDPGAHTYLWSVSGSANSYTVISGTDQPNFTFKPRDNGDFTVSLKVTNSSGQNKIVAIPVKVENVAPVVSELVVIVDQNGGTGVLTGKITDASPLDTFTLSVDWGDGRSSLHTFAAGTTDFTAEHVFLDGQIPLGGYQASLVLTDDDQGAALGAVTSISPWKWPQAPTLDDAPARPLPGSVGPAGVAPPVLSGSATDNSRAEAAATAVYNQAVTVATQRYAQAQRESEGTLARELVEAEKREQLAKDAADRLRSQTLATVNPYNVSVASANYNQLVQDYRETYDTKTGDSWQDYLDAIAGAPADPAVQISAIAQYNREESEWRRDYYVALHAAWKTYQTVVINANNWTQQNQINADTQRDKDYATAARQRQYENADATLRHDGRLVQAALERDLAQADAEVGRDRQIGAGLVSAAMAAAAIAPSAWTNYQVTLASALKTHQDTLADKRLHQLTQDAQSVERENKSLAEKRKDRDYQLADKDFGYQVAVEDANADLNRAQATRQRTSLLYGLDQWHTTLDYYSEKQHSYRVERQNAMEARDLALQGESDPNVQNQIRRDADLALTAAARNLADLDGQQGAAYEKLIHAEQKSAAIDEADYLDAAEKKLSAALGGYQQGHREAENEYRRAETGAIKDRLIELAQHARAYADETAPLESALTLQKANLEANFKNAAMNDYLGALTVWSQTEDTPWSRHVLATIDAEADRIEAYGAASVTYATALASQDLAAQQGEAAASYDYAFHQADELAKTQSGLIDLDNARTVEVVTRVQQRSDDRTDAHTKHDKSVITANWDFSDDLSDGWQLARDLFNDAYYDYEEARVHDQYDPQYDLSTATADYWSALSGAYRSLQTNEAADRKDWVDQVADARQLREEEIAQADTEWANAIHLVDTVYAVDIGAKLRDYEYGMADRTQTMELAFARIDRGWADRMAEPTRQRSVAEITADAEHAFDVAATDRTYAVEQAQEYSTLVASWSASPGTSAADFIAEAASAEAAYQANLAQQDLTLAEKRREKTIARGRDDAQLDRELALGLAAENYRYAEQAADTVRAEARGFAEAARKQSVRVNTAEVGRAWATVVEDATQRGSNAAAETAWAKEDARIQKNFVNDLMAATTVTDWAELHQNLGPGTSVDPAVRTALETARDNQQRANNVARVEQLADAAILRATRLGDADISLADEVGAAQVEYATDRQTAANTRAAAEKIAADQQQGEELTQRVYNRFYHAFEEHEFSTAMNEAQSVFETGQSTAATTYTLAIASAEAEFHRERAAEETSLTASRHAAQGTPQSLLVSQYAAAREDWINELTTGAAPAFQAKWQARAQADAAKTIDSAAIERSKGDRAAELALDYLIKATEADQKRQGDGFPFLSSDLTAAVARTYQHELDLALADQRLTHEIAAALKGYAVDSLEADKTYRRAQTNGENESAALPTWNNELKAAKVDLVTKQEDAFVVWSTDVAEAEAALTIGAAEAKKNLTVAHAAHKKTWSDTRADLLAARDKALTIVATDAFGAHVVSRPTAAGQLSVDAAWAAQTTAAEAAFLGTSHQAATTNLDALHTTSGTPLSQYLSQRGHALDGWTATRAANMNQFVADTSALDAAQNARIRDAQKLNTDTVADAEAVKTKGLALAEYNYTFALATAEFDYINGAGSEFDGAARQAIDYQTALAEARRSHEIALAGGTSSTLNTTEQTRDYRTAYYNATHDARATAIEAIYDHYEATSGTSGLLNTWQTSASDANKANRLTTNDARYLGTTQAANLTLAYHTGLANGPADALDALAAGNPSGPWAALEASVADRFATSYIGSAETQWDTTRSNASDLKTHDDGTATQDAINEKARTGNVQSFIFGDASAKHTSAQGALSNELTLAQNGNYFPQFIPQEMRARDYINETGRTTFNPGASPINSSLNYFGTGFWNHNAYGVGWGSWGAYWGASRDADGNYVPLGALDVAPAAPPAWQGIGFQYYGAFWYGLGQTFVNGQTGTTQLAARDSAVAGAAAVTAQNLPNPSEVLPNNIHFAEGNFANSAANTAVSAETMLRFRDRVFDQMDQSSFWSDPVVYTAQGDSDLDALLQISRPVTVPQLDFAALATAAHNQSGFGADTVDAVAAGMPQEEEEPGAAAQPGQVDFLFNLKEISPEIVDSIVPKGSHLRRTVSENTFWFFRDSATFVVVPNYTSDGRFVNNLVLQYFPVLVWEGQVVLPAHYSLVGIDKTEISADHSVDRIVNHAFIEYRRGSAAFTENALTFSLHLVPLGAGIDQARQGDLYEAGISFAGDLASVLSLGAGKVFTTARAVNTAQKAAIAIEGGIGAVRLGQSVYHFSQGETAQAAGELGESLLRLAGVSAATIKQMRGAADEVASNLKKVGHTLDTSVEGMRQRRRLFAETSVEFVDDLSPGTLGDTDPYGNIRIAINLTPQQREMTLFHEQVHSWLSPKFMLMRDIRAKFGIGAYKLSHLIRYTEEAMAETHAQLRTHGFSGVIDGLLYPVNEGYVKVWRVVTEAAIGTIIVGGTTYGVYLISDDVFSAGT